MNKTLLTIVGSLVVLVAALAILSQPGGKRVSTPTTTSGTTGNDVPNSQAEPLVLYCAASNRAVVDAIRKEYEAEYGRQVQVEFGPSQTLLSKMEVSHTGDLYLPADDSFLEIARDKKIVQEVLQLAEMKATLAVRKGNPKSIHVWADLLKPDIKLIQASTEASAIGKLTKARLSQKNLWTELDGATDAYLTTVNDVANDVMVGAADVGIVYDAILASYKELESIPLADLSEMVSKVAVGVVSSSKQPAQALHFARYLSAHDRGGKVYKQFGFTTVDGDTWKDIPELNLFAGSMLRPAIDETITAFEEREGVRVSRVYNGCGILVAQMKAGQLPDAYFACDREFMNQVRDVFPNPVDVSQNQLVILVKKGNPLNVRTLRDLTRKGLRVGIGHEKQCAMGWITQNTFREGGIQTEVMENVTVQTPTGDMLVNQLKAGSLDAAVAYISNAAGSADELDAIVIEGIQCATAIQPWGVAAKTEYPQLTNRLYEKLRSAESRDIFSSEGFGWLNEDAVSSPPSVHVGRE